MDRIKTRMAPVAVAMLGMVALAACKSKEQSAAGEVGTPPDTSAILVPPTPMGGTVSTPAASTSTPDAKWTNPAVLGFATSANDGEIEMGKLGQQMASSAAVKAFATLMVTEHTAMLADTKALASKLGATPDTAADDARDLAKHGGDELADLRGKARGADWDKDYMDKMIDDHQKVLDHLQDAAKNSADSTMRAALEKVAGKVQTHLTKAKDVAHKS